MMSDCTIVTHVGMEASRTGFPFVWLAIPACVLPLLAPFLKSPTFVACRQKRSALTSDHLFVVGSNLAR